MAAADVVTQAVTAGTRTASVANLTLASTAYSHSAQTSTGTMTLTADDSTGSNLGWNVTVLSSAFVYSGGNNGTNIPAANFALTSAAAPVMTAGQAVDTLGVGGPKVPLTSPVGTLDLARKTVQAALLFGNGTYTQAFGVSLTVPAQSAAGTYTGTLTTTIAAAP
ncbi:MAG: WxL domain-containing protein [Candidatus Limnocylindria bacterium]